MDIRHYLKLAEQIQNLQYQLIFKADKQASTEAREKTLQLISLASQLSQGLLLASTDKRRDLPERFDEDVDKAALELKVVQARISGRDHDLYTAIARTHEALGKTIRILEVVGRWPPDPPPSDDESDSSSNQRKR